MRVLCGRREFAKREVRGYWIISNVPPEVGTGYRLGGTKLFLGRTGSTDWLEPPGWGRVRRGTDPSGTYLPPCPPRVTAVQGFSSVTTVEYGTVWYGESCTSRTGLPRRKFFPYSPPLKKNSKSRYCLTFRFLYAYFLSKQRIKRN
jgi:hypothetical protein